MDPLTLWRSQKFKQGDSKIKNCQGDSKSFHHKSIIGVLISSDGNLEFMKAIGCELDLSDKPLGLGVRSRRYAMLVDDGVVKVLNLEEGGAFNVSSAEAIPKAL